MAETQDTQDVRSFVRERYGKIAEEFKPKAGAASCCGPSDSSCCSGETSSVVRLYETPDAATLPDEVAGLSLGCGDPVTLASLTPGQTVLDLGSGGGIDCFLAARQVGPQGRVIGVDMTPAMLDKARANKARLGIDNVEFRMGEIEHLPVADNTVDVIISNCVINLSPDKPQVFSEAYRVLKSGGKLAVSDIVTDGPLPPQIKSSLSAWAGCVAGALEVEDYLGAMKAAGFVDVKLTPVYFDAQVVDEAVAQAGESLDLHDISNEVLQKAVFSAKITARKP
jgi:SAM-dependent methyltransferase